MVRPRRRADYRAKLRELDSINLDKRIKEYRRTGKVQHNIRNTHTTKGFTTSRTPKQFISNRETFYSTFLFNILYVKL